MYKQGHFGLGLLSTSLFALTVAELGYLTWVPLIALAGIAGGLLPDIDNKPVIPFQPPRLDPHCPIWISRQWNRHQSVACRVLQHTADTFCDPYCTPSRLDIRIRPPGRYTVPLLSRRYLLASVW